MRCLLGVVVFFVWTLPAYPEILSVGVKGGVPLTEAFDTARSGPLAFAAATRRYTFGPTVELHLARGLGVEFDALYRRVSYESDLTSTGQVVVRRTTGNSWEFPLLLKIRFGESSATPYITTGASFQHLSGLTQIGDFFEGSTQRRVETSRPGELQNRFNAGFVIGGGLELHAGPMRISPEVRYTRWGWESFRDVSGFLRSNQDQAAFLVGITF